MASMMASTTYGECKGCGEYGQLTDAHPVSGRNKVVSIKAVYGYCQTCLMGGVATPVVGTEVKVGKVTVREMRHATSRDVMQTVALGQVFGIPTKNVGFTPNGTSIGYSGVYNSDSDMFRYGHCVSPLSSLGYLYAIAETEEAEERANERRRKEEAEANERRRKEEAEANERRRQEEAFAYYANERKRQKARDDARAELVELQRKKAIEEEIRQQEPDPELVELRKQIDALKQSFHR